MSLNNLTLSQAVLRQYKITMQTVGRSYYRYLIILQFVAMLFISFSSGYGGGNKLIQLRFTQYASSSEIWFSVMYAIAITYVLASQNNRDIAFTFVSSRLSHHLACIAAIISFCGLTAVIGSLSLVLSRVITVLAGTQYVILDGFHLTLGELGLCMLSVFCYTLMAASFIYLLAILLRRMPRLLLLIPIAFVVVLLALIFGVFSMSQEISDVFRWLYTYFAMENNLLLFMLKTLSATVVFFAATIPCGHGLEVRH